MEEDDIAAAMGFSSFGGQKKRKYDQASSPKSTANASGANSTRLGVRPKTIETNAGEGADAPGWKANDIVESTETEPNLNATRKLKQPAASSLADFLSRGQNLPDKPVSNEEAPAPNVEEIANVEQDDSATLSFGGPPVTKAALNELRRGVRNEHGDMVYFLPSFVEDPWEKLRKNTN